MADRNSSSRGPTISARLSTVEQDVRYHSKTLSEIVMAHTTMSERIVVLERKEQETEKLEIRKEERDKAMALWQTSVNEELKAIKGVGTKILWIVVTAVIGAFVMFLLRGGIVP